MLGQGFSFHWILDEENIIGEICGVLRAIIGWCAREVSFVRCGFGGANRLETLVYWSSRWCGRMGRIEEQIQRKWCRIVKFLSVEELKNWEMEKMLRKAWKIGVVSWQKCDSRMCAKGWSLRYENDWVAVAPAWHRSFSNSRNPSEPISPAILKRHRMITMPHMPCVINSMETLRSSNGCLLVPLKQKKYWNCAEKNIALACW